MRHKKKSHLYKIDMDLMLLTKRIQQKDIRQELSSNKVDRKSMLLTKRVLIFSCLLIFLSFTMIDHRNCRRSPSFISLLTLLLYSREFLQRTKLLPFCCTHSLYFIILLIISYYSYSYIHTYFIMFDIFTPMALTMACIRGFDSFTEIAWDSSNSALVLSSTVSRPMYSSPFNSGRLARIKDNRKHINFTTLFFYTNITQILKHNSDLHSTEVF